MIATPASVTRARVAPARLFLALWPDELTRAALASLRAALPWPPGARPTPDAKLHMTLHFIGAVARQWLPEIEQGLALSAPVPAFDLMLDQTVSGSGGLVWLAPRAPPEALLVLHAGLAAALRRLQLPVEQRRFRPHVTLARDCSAALSPARLALPGVQPLRWPVAGYALVESAASGHYEVLRHYGSRHS